MRVVQGAEALPVLLERSLYFGYGSEADPKIFEIVTGQDPVVIFAPHQVAMSGFTLAAHKLRDVPPVGSRNSDTNPREILAENWGHGAAEEDELEFYSMFPTIQTASKVLGTLYGGVRGEALSRLTRWSLEGDWRRMAVGPVSALSHDKKWVELPMKARTSAIRRKDGFDRIVDGNGYQVHLMGEEATRQAAERFAASQG